MSTRTSSQGSRGRGGVCDGGPEGLGGVEIGSLGNRRAGAGEDVDEGGRVLAGDRPARDARIPFQSSCAQAGLSRRSGFRQAAMLFRNRARGLPCVGGQAGGVQSAAAVPDRHGVELWLWSWTLDTLFTTAGAYCAVLCI